MLFCIISQSGFSKNWSSLKWKSGANSKSSGSKRSSHFKRFPAYGTFIMKWKWSKVFSSLTILFGIRDISLRVISDKPRKL